jgi:hypothetical protein
MRTTLTIDDELFDQIRAEAARTRRPFRDVLNERLRLGFSARKARAGSAKFTVKPFNTPGFAPGVDEKKLNQLLDTLDTEERNR